VPLCLWKRAGQVESQIVGSDLPGSTLDRDAVQPRSRAMAMSRRLFMTLPTPALRSRARFMEDLRDQPLAHLSNPFEPGF